MPIKINPVRIEGGKLIQDTGMDPYQIFNKGMRNEIHAKRNWSFRDTEDYLDAKGHQLRRTIGDYFIIETLEGEFVFMDGSFINDRKILEKIEPKADKDYALAWFDKKFPPAPERQVKA